MKPINSPGPRWPFRIAVGGMVLVGSICLMPAILSLGDQDWIGLLIAVLAMALHFVLAVFIYQRKLWAVITALILYSLPLLAYTFLLGFVILRTMRPGRLNSSGLSRGLAVVGSIDIVLWFFLYCLFKCIRLILHSRRESMPGFEVLTTTLPVEEIVEPEDDPFNNIQ